MAANIRGIIESTETSTPGMKILTVIICEISTMIYHGETIKSPTIANPFQRVLYR